MRAVLQRLALAALATAGAGARAADAPPTPSPVAPPEPMARVEQFVVRDVVQADGSVVRSEDVVVQVHTAMGKRHLFDVPGEAPPGGAQLRLKLLVDQRGRIVDIRPAQPADAAALDAWRARVLQTALPAFDVDGATFKLVRAATLKCAADHGCRLGLNYYGDEVATVLER